MATLKELKVRQKSVRSTRKITMAMKMIAAAKLKKAQQQAEALVPYASAVAEMVSDVLEKVDVYEHPPRLLLGREDVQTHLILITTSDRGLCGGFNGSLIREAERLIAQYKAQGHDFRLICVGRRGYEVLSGRYPDKVVLNFNAPDKPAFSTAQKIAQSIIEMFDEHIIDECTLVYNAFLSAMLQRVTTHKLVPFAPDRVEKAEETVGPKIPYIYEPSEEVVLEKLLPKNLAIQIYRALIENSAGEKGARMTAMDGATRNADEMNKKLTLEYNRTRQAYITKELIEIISGAEALSDQ